ncbi:hypothetical protein HK405_011604 [Cladochytrium tenue]|nr:hypothetical protein HK405_011604 [Cladochytrium tenue]
MTTSPAVVVVKATLGTQPAIAGPFRRFTLPVGAGFGDLRRGAVTALGLAPPPPLSDPDSSEPHPPFRIEYLDDEGDWIAMSSEAEFLEAIRCGADRATATVAASLKIRVWGATAGTARRRATGLVIPASTTPIIEATPIPEMVTSSSFAQETLGPDAADDVVVSTELRQILPSEEEHNDDSRNELESAFEDALERHTEVNADVPSSSRPANADGHDMEGTVPTFPGYPSITNASVPDVPGLSYSGDFTSGAQSSSKLPDYEPEEPVSQPFAAANDKGSSSLPPPYGVIPIGSSRSFDYHFHRAIIQSAVADAVRSLLGIPNGRTVYDYAVAEINLGRAVIISTIEDALGTNRGASTESEFDRSWRARHAAALASFRDAVTSIGATARRAAQSAGDHIVASGIVQSLQELAGRIQANRPGEAVGAAESPVTRVRTAVRSAVSSLPPLAESVVRSSTQAGRQLAESAVRTGTQAGRVLASDLHSASRRVATDLRNNGRNLANDLREPVRVALSVVGMTVLAVGGVLTEMGNMVADASQQARAQAAAAAAAGAVFATPENGTVLFASMPSADDSAISAADSVDPTTAFHRSDDVPVTQSSPGTLTPDTEVATAPTREPIAETVANVVPSSASAHIPTAGTVDISAVMTVPMEEAEIAMEEVETAEPAPANNADDVPEPETLPPWPSVSAAAAARASTASAASVASDPVAVVTDEESVADMSRSGGPARRRRRQRPLAGADEDGDEDEDDDDDSLDDELDAFVVVDDRSDGPPFSPVPSHPGSRFGFY